MADNLPFTNLDFQNVKDNLKAYLQGQDQFKDYNFEGSNINVLLDVLAYNTFKNNYYTNMAISEMFLDSAELRDSVVSHAKELNYIPRSRRSARAVVDLEIFPQTTPASISLAENLEFTARCGTKTYKFYTRESELITPVDGRYIASGLPVYEGKIIEEIFNVDGTASQRFVISNFNVDTTSIKVYVKANSNSTTETEYVYKEDIYGVTPSDNVFYLQPYVGDKYEIIFGEDVFGNNPISGNVIRVAYQRTAGEEANGIGLMSLTNEIAGTTSTTTVTAASNGGSEIESIDSIKYFAPKSIQIQNRAVTASDYKILVQNNFPEIKSAAAYGGENLFPPQFGRVVIAVDSVSGDGISENTRETISAFLADKSALSIEPIIINSKFMYLSVNSTVYYNRNFTSKGASNIGQAVTNAITQYSFNNLEQYEKDFKYSRFSSEIDNADEYITSNDTTVTPFMEIYPRRNFSSYFILQFKNQIQSSLPYVETSLANYNAAIYSNTFTYKGYSTAFIQDNGSGQLNVVRRTDDGTVEILERNLGSVDYETGDVILRYITIQDYPSTGIKIYANLSGKKIVAPFDRIIRIRAADTRINVIGIRE